MIESLGAAVVHGLTPLGVAAGLALGWRRGRDTAAFVRWAAAGGLACGVVADLLTTVLPGDWEGYRWFGGVFLGPTLGTLGGLVLGAGVALWRLAGPLVQRRARSTAFGATNRRG
jgi:hypothetical protein